MADDKHIDAIECTEEDIFPSEHVELATIPAEQFEAMKKELVALRAQLDEYQIAIRHSRLLLQAGEERSALLCLGDALKTKPVPTADTEAE